MRLISKVVLVVLLAPILVALPSCLARQVVIEHEAGIEIKQHPCRLVATVDGDQVFQMDGSKNKVNCPVEVEP